jgi:hypothetical protein
MCNPLKASNMIVLIGVKLHKALYPSRDALLADASGMDVTIARQK